SATTRIAGRGCRSASCVHDGQAAATGCARAAPRHRIATPAGGIDQTSTGASHVKLGSLKQGGRDGTLVVVSRDLARAVRVGDIAGTLQAALEDGGNAAPRLNRVYELIDATPAQTINGEDVFALDAAALAAPLPRAYEFVDGSAYLPHVERVRRARG